MGLWSTYACCASSPSKGWDYRITSSSTDHYTAAVYNSASSSTYYTRSSCQVRSSGGSCTGAACVSSTRNDCDDDTLGPSSSVTSGLLCLKIKCDNWFRSCSFDSVSTSFYSTSLPSPSRPPPPSTNYDYYPRPPPPRMSNVYAPQTTPTTVRVPTPSYTTTKKSAKGVKAGLGVGLSIAVSICAWCLRFSCCSKKSTSSDPELVSVQTNLAPLHREAPVMC